MGELLVKNKDIVVPGEELAIGIDYLPAGGVFREKDKIIALQVGLVNISGHLIKLIPLSGKYFPKKGDIVIGRVTDISFYGWRVDIGCAYEANLSIKEAVSDYIDKRADLSQYYNYGEIIAAEIIHVSGSKIIDLTTNGPSLRKLKGGKIIEVSPSKVPRIIGKQGSMINLIKEKTDCKITVGQNGIIWISGTNPKKEMIATEVIHKINEEAHIDGLTDKIQKFLDKEIK